MRTSPPHASKWLSLGEAALEVGVHPTTLRRWADRGALPVMRTPGGHRRFALADIRRIAQHQQDPAQAQGIEVAWAGKAMTRVREQLTLSGRAQWMTACTSEERTEYRELGRRLMSVAMHFIADGASNQHLLEEADAIGRAQATMALRHDLSLTETLGAALIFRDALLEVAFQLPDHTRVHPDATARLVRGINTLLNAVQLAIGATYEHAFTGARR